MDPPASKPLRPVGWHRPVGWRALIVVSLLILAGWLVLMTGLVWWLRGHWEALAVIRNIPVSLSLPSGMKASAEVHSVLHTRLDMTQSLAVPVDQLMQVQVMDRLNARAQVHTVVPVSTTVAFAADIPVSTQVQAEVPVVSWLPAMTVNVPVRFVVPVKVSVPVKVDVPLNLDMQVRADVPDALQVPLKATFMARIPIHADIRSQLTRQADFTLAHGIHAMPLMIESASLNLPFTAVKWELREEGAVGLSPAAASTR
jgi:hypothetical protein